MAKKKRQRVRRIKEKKMTGKMQRKLVALFALVLLAMVALNARLVYINAASGDKYTKKVLSQKGYKSTTIPFRRGSIQDINGELLAVSEKVYYVILDCSVLNKLNEKIRDKAQAETIEALTECFEELDAATIRGYLADKPDSSYLRILKNKTYEEIQTFKEKQEAEGSLIRGVWFEETYIRSYPGEHLASNLLGFTLSGNVGNWGVEEYYNDVLNGTEGRTYGYLNSDSNVETNTQAAVDGHNVILNLDATIQRIIEEKVTAFNESHRDEAAPGLGSKHTAVIVTDPNKNTILGMCSYPYYNLNSPRDLTYLGQYTKEEVEALPKLSDYTEEELKEDSTLAAGTIEGKLTAMWRNFCISDTYEPGSTFKPFTVAMGLESGKLTGKESYYCNGFEIVDGTQVKCSHTSGHGSLTFEDTIGQSCNDALMQMSYVIGPEVFTSYQTSFGFGKKTGIDLKGEVNAAGLLYTLENMKPIDLAVNSFGQNFNATMVQMMSGFNALVNGGYYYQPQVANRIESVDGEVIEQFEPKLLKKIVSEETSEEIRKCLKTVVEKGTAPSAAIEGYSVGGKTGTAEKFPRKQGKYLVSFMMAVPVENPELTCYVIIDEPNVENQANSKLAMDLCRDIMAEVLPYYGVSKVGETDAEDTTEDTTEDTQSSVNWEYADDAWENGESFTDGEIDNPEGDGSEYYENGDTGYTGDDEGYGDSYEGEYTWGED